ncbi:hypothetical protein ACWDYH_24295 [Nocardia goodfellowii]|uniref:Uncharacterized protein n=1 Tax=Nocardia goodfellowii TaxID=882446 RepID=A0ABS4QI68_9NOCA|nr:hypothetical protein [Nocardia goodfellowii]MBP2190850.1 hypothetical protein [Nocardia goodfellowii]
MLPIAADLAVKAVRSQANSALPCAPVRADAAPRTPHLRVWAAALLRASAQRSVRLADRLDHAPVHLAHR